MKFKILLVGDWHSNLHEEAVKQALEELGQEVICFPWHQYFKPNSKVGQFLSPLFKFQNKYLCGPTLKSLNEDIVSIFRQYLPDVVFVYRGTHVFPETLKQIKSVRPETILVGYNNDDPFSPEYPRWLWRHFIAGLPEYDLVLAYREQNIMEFKRCGAKKVEMMRSWFLPWVHTPINLSEEDRNRFGCDVTFVGHYEDDGRIDYLEDVVDLGFKLRLWGPGYEWDHVIEKRPKLRGLLPVSLVWDHDYNKAISASKIALCFFSRLNRDTYTRRCFEIPAGATFLFSEFSEDLGSLYKESVEAEYFRSREEFRQKLVKYLRHDEATRLQIAKAGYFRVTQDGHDVVSRMRELLVQIEAIVNSQHVEVTGALN